VTSFHLNPFWREVTFMQNVCGREPTKFLADHGFQHEGLICAHCRCITQGEERMLGDYRAGVAFNSVIAARRGMMARVTNLEGYGAKISLGSDNFAQDMVEVIRHALYMERVRT
jgi:5-methylthioadenosine/S-adenosylhomocysteine deaminase